MVVRRGALAQLIVFIALMVAAVVAVGVIISTTGKATAEAKKAQVEIPAEALEIAGTRTLGILADTGDSTLVALADAIKKYYDEQLKNPSFAVKVKNFDELAGKDAAIIIGWFDDNLHTVDTLAMYIAGDVLTNKKILWILPNYTNIDNTNEGGVDNTFKISVTSNKGSFSEARGGSAAIKKLTSKVTASALLGNNGIQMDKSAADSVLQEALAIDTNVIIFTSPKDPSAGDHGVIEVRLANGNIIFFVIVQEQAINDFIQGKTTANAKALGQLLVNFPALLA